MLCSECNKNNAVVFINKQDDKGNSSMEGLCYECAEKEIRSSGYVLSRQLYA